MEARRPDLILVNKKAKSCVIIDVAIPGDCRIREKEIEKIEKYLGCCSSPRSASDAISIRFNPLLRNFVKWSDTL